MEKNRKIVSRVLYNINKIKASVDKDPRHGVAFSSFASEVARALKEAKILVNYGSNHQPVYSFSETITVDENLAAEIADSITKYRKERYPYLYKKEEKKEEPVQEEPKEEEWKVITEDQIYEMGIKQYTDEQLWAELKRRGWGIADGCISKTVTYSMC